MKYEKGTWMVRFSQNGLGYNGFRWAEIGEWTYPDTWDPRPGCGNGLHGQSNVAGGYCPAGTRFEFCETGVQIEIDGNKVKTNRAKIIVVNEAAFILLSHHQTGNISLDLRKYPHPLPAELTSVGGDL